MISPSPNKITPLTKIKISDPPPPLSAKMFLKFLPPPSPPPPATQAGGECMPWAQCPYNSNDTKTCPTQHYDHTPSTIYHSSPTPPPTSLSYNHSPLVWNHELPLKKTTNVCRFPESIYTQVFNLSGGTYHHPSYKK